MPKQKYYRVYTPKSSMIRLELFVKTSKKKKAIQLAKEDLRQDDIELKAERIRFPKDTIVMRKETQIRTIGGAHPSTIQA